MKHNKGEEDPRTSLGELLNEELRINYLGRPCAICGDVVLTNEIDKIIIGRSYRHRDDRKKVTSIRHRDCLRLYTPHQEWVYPVEVI